MLFRRFAVLAALLGVIACGGAADPPPPAVGSRAGDTVTAVLAAYRVAAGGDALDRVRRLRATGVSYTGAAKSNQRLVLETAAPGQFRQYEAPVDDRSRQVVMVVGLDGAAGWRMGNTRLGGDGLSPDPVIRARAETLAARQNYLNALSGILPLLLQADPAVTMTMAASTGNGREREAHAVAISTADGAAGRLLFDRATSLPWKFIAPYQRHIRPAGGEYTLTFSDFRVVEGVTLPFQITRTSDTTPEARWSFSAYAINPDFPADTFKKPAK